jgi:uncharacterized membrane protein YhaH (DUF805 family)
MVQNNPYQAPGAKVYDVSADGGGFDETSPFSPKGRFGRLSYLAWGTLVNFVLFVIFAVVIGGVSAMQQQAMTGSPLILVLEVPIIVVAILFSIRRFHDINASGWWSVSMVVPIVNLVAALILLFKAGSVGSNDYGPVRVTRGWEKVVGYIAIGFMILALVGIIAAIVIPMLVPTHQ